LGIEIEVRKSFPAGIQSKIVQVDLEHLVVVEELLCGYFLTRLATKEFDREIETFLATNGQMVRQRSSDEAIVIIKNSCLVMGIPIAKGCQFLAVVDEQLTGHYFGPMALSHGDAHRGNIIINDGNFHFIDWEFSAVRYKYYDYFVFDLGLRTNGGIRDFSINSFATSLRKLEQIVSANIDAPTAYLHLIVEELAFRSQLYESARGSSSLEIFSQKIARDYLKKLEDFRASAF
jgi:hypothetical protein